MVPTHGSVGGPIFTQIPKRTLVLGYRQDWSPQLFLFSLALFVLPPLSVICPFLTPGSSPLIPLWAALQGRGPVFNRSLPSILVAVPQPAPLPIAKPPDDAPHRKRCLWRKADFTGSAQFPASTEFATRAAITAAVVRWRWRWWRRSCWW